MSLSHQEVNNAMQQLSTLSYQKYKTYNHLAGFYEAMLYGVMLGHDTPAQVLERIQFKVAEYNEENQAEIDALAAAGSMPRG